MDIDVFPNSIEYWGPNGMVFFRNVQLAWMPIQGDDSRLDVALERPGASADSGDYRGPRRARRTSSRASRCPTLAAEYRSRGQWGYVELAGIFRYIKWDDLGTDALDSSGHASAGAST